MHPGPVNRGVELSAEVIESPQALIVDQVAACGAQTRFDIYVNDVFQRVTSVKEPTLLCKFSPRATSVKVEVYAPSDFAGDLMGDLNSRRGRIAGMDTRGSTTVIRAQVPMAEMLTYEQHLTSATGGRGSYHMEYSHYEEVPQQQQAKIIAAAKAEKGAAVVEEV